MDFESLLVQRMCRWDRQDHIADLAELHDKSMLAKSYAGFQIQSEFTSQHPTAAQ
jgi:hypothetical protein